MALCFMAAPLRAAEPETRVLFLNATDPYLPGYLAIDAAMRETLAKNTTRRFQYFTETLDAQRFALADFEQVRPVMIFLSGPMKRRESPGSEATESRAARCRPHS
jgi:hypothetical protein